MNFNFLSPSERKRLIKEFEDMYGIGKQDLLFVSTGKEKIRAFSGSMGKEELEEFAQVARVEIIGLYVAKSDNLRLSFDATQIFSEEISKNIIELTQEDFDKWIRGQNLDIKKERGVYVLKYKDDFLGCALSDGERLWNHVPKERRIRN